MNGNSNMEINDLQRDGEVESRACAIFRNACEAADSHHVLRLGLARRKALDAGTTRWPVQRWAPMAAAVACCAVVVAGVAWMRATPHLTPSPVVASAPITASPADSDDDTPEVGTSQMEMVQNLDFYRWLAAQPSVASVPAGSGRQ